MAKTPLKWDKGHGWHRLDVDGRSYHIDEYGTYVTLTIDEDKPTQEDLGRFATVKAAKAAVKRRLAGGGDGG